MFRYKYTTPPPTLRVIYDGAEVAELVRDRGKFRFRYLADFRAKSLAPLPGLPDVDTDRVYESIDLPRFFAERIPDIHRPEIRQWMQDHGLSETDELALLARLGRHSVTDPFEFKLEGRAA